MNKWRRENVARLPELLRVASVLRSIAGTIWRRLAFCGSSRLRIAMHPSKRMDAARRPKILRSSRSGWVWWPATSYTELAIFGAGNQLATNSRARNHQQFARPPVVNWSRDHLLVDLPLGALTYEKMS